MKSVVWGMKAPEMLVIAEVENDLWVYEMGLPC